MKRKPLGIIGTGMLGHAVGAHLLDAGYDLFAYNRTPGRTAELESSGATICKTPGAVAERSDFAIIAVTDADAVRQVSFGSGGICEGIHDGLVISDMSTIDPSASRQITERFAEHKTIKLDIPVMGGPNVAISGDLTMMASGDRTTFEQNRGILETIARRVFYIGPPGAAHATKLAMNLQIAMLALSLSEGITLARATGIDPGVFLEVLNSTYFGTGMSKNKAFKMIDGMFEPTFTLRNLRKDLHTINRTSKSLGAALPMSGLAEEIYNAATDAGFGDLDYTGILKYIRTLRAPSGRRIRDP